MLLGSQHPNIDDVETPGNRVAGHLDGVDRHLCAEEGLTGLEDPGVAVDDDGAVEPASGSDTQDDLWSHPGRVAHRDRHRRGHVRPTSNRSTNVDAPPNPPGFVTR